VFFGIMQDVDILSLYQISKEAKTCMSLKRAVAIWVAVIATVISLGFPIGTWASHRWGCWKYADANINFYNGVSTSDVYRSYFQDEAINDGDSWHNYTDVNLNPVSSSGRTDHVNCYAGNYGNNGWLGIAEIRRYSGCTIREGRARLNKTYLQNPAYGYTTTNKKHVACQEVGHLWGLNHQYAGDTCMNDSILTQPQPNAHDQDLVNSIY
jgi:hypothetical protein